MLKYLVTSPVVEILGDELYRIGKHRYGVCEDWIMEKAKAIEAKRAQTRGMGDNAASSELEIQPPAWVVWNRPEGEPVKARITGRAYELLKYLLSHGGTAHVLDLSATIWNSSEDETNSINAAQKGINDTLKKAEIPFSAEGSQNQKRFSSQGGIPPAKAIGKDEKIPGEEGSLPDCQNNPSGSG